MRALSDLPSAGLAAARNRSRAALVGRLPVEPIASTGMLMPPSELSKLKIDRGGSKSAVRPRRRWTKLASIAVILVLLAAFAAVRLNGPAAVETVTVASAYPSQSYTLLNATGYVVPQRKASVASKAQGRLEWLGVLEGSRVKKDEVIARLENKDVRASSEQAVAQVKVAQANLEQGMAEMSDAEANLRRSDELLAKKFISEAQHGTDIARYNKAKAAISGFRSMILSAQANARVAEVAADQTVIRAPFDGVVLTKNANEGDNITPFSSAADSKGAVVTIADMETLEVEADVAESNIAKIQVNQPCEIQLDALPDIRLAGTVSRTVPTVDRSKATVLVKVRFVDKDPRVLPDMSAKVAFLSKPVPAEDKTPVTAVQPTAIVQRNGTNVVFVVKDHTVQEVAVTPGRKIGELVQVSAVNPGDKLVINPSETLKNGMKISVAKK
jgi:HlyD family secretion protein